MVAFLQKIRISTCDSNYLEKQDYSHNFSDFCLENPVFLTSEIPGFSEPKLEKPCISEFRETKSENLVFIRQESTLVLNQKNLFFSVFQDL